MGDNQGDYSFETIDCLSDTTTNITCACGTHQREIIEFEEGASGSSGKVSNLQNYEIYDDYDLKKIKCGKNHIAAVGDSHEYEDRSLLTYKRKKSGGRGYLHSGMRLNDDSDYEDANDMDIDFSGSEGTEQLYMQEKGNTSYDIYDVDDGFIKLNDPKEKNVLNSGIGFNRNQPSLSQQVTQDQQSVPLDNVYYKEREDGNGYEEEDGSLLWLWILLIVLAILICIVCVALAIFGLMSPASNKGGAGKSGRGNAGRNTSPEKRYRESRIEESRGNSTSRKRLYDDYESGPRRSYEMERYDSMNDGPSEFSYNGGR